jgi:hypothetical protein
VADGVVAAAGIRPRFGPGTARAGRPGFSATRLLRLMEEAVADCRLDLSGVEVLTEAASGAYAVTAVLAALAGARHVTAFVRDSRHCTAREAADATLTLAAAAGVRERIRVSAQRSAQHVAAADIVTNSGHVRPIDAEMVGWMKPTAVVALMFEAWELQAGRIDVDLDALRRRGLAFAGTNERHPAVGVFGYLGAMAARLLLDAGLPVHRSRIALLCDNPFRDYLVGGLEGAGAEVRSAAQVADLDAGWRPDVVLAALRPRDGDTIGAADAGVIARRWPGVLVAQFWGDLDRAALERVGLPCWPAQGPPRGHMGVLPSDVGPDPVVRLQAGGLKVGAVLLTPPALRSDFDRGFLDEL